jgi:hypothetical protein
VGHDDGPLLEAPQAARADLDAERHVGEDTASLRSSVPSAGTLMITWLRLALEAAATNCSAGGVIRAPT